MLIVKEIAGGIFVSFIGAIFGGTLGTGAIKTTGWTMILGAGVSNNS